MCSHFDPIIDSKKLRKYFAIDDLPSGLKDSLWPGYIGPFIRRHAHADTGDAAVADNELLVGAFGLIPHWAKDTKIGRKTYNARTETVHEKPSFRDSWHKARHCIIPAEAIFEPDWRSGKAKQTRIIRSDGKPLAIAGLWASWQSPQDNKILHSFTMLTINADDHAFMRDYHKPDDEKMLCFLHDDEHQAWLSASPDNSRQLLRQYPPELLTVSN